MQLPKHLFYSLGTCDQKINKGGILMQNFIKNIAITGLCIAAFHGSASAAHRDNSVSVGANVGYTDFAHNGFMMKDEVTAGVTLGYDLNPKNSLEMTANWLHTRRDDGSNKREDGGLLLFDYVRHFNTDGVIQPIVFAGPGYMHLKNPTQPTDTFNINYGVGAEWFFTNNLALRVDARDVYTPRKRLHMGLYSASLVYVIGGNHQDSGVEDIFKGANFADEQEIKSTPVALENSSWEPVAVVAKSPCVKQQNSNENMHVNFEHNSSQLTATAKGKLNKLAECLIDSPHEKVYLSGYASQPGTENYNLMISEKRSKAVKDYLVKRGVDDANLSIKGYGAHDLIDAHVDTLAQAKNRRVEITSEVS